MKIASKTKITEKWLVPLIILGICIVAFGLQISKLGYYVDDWIVLYSYTNGGVRGLMGLTFATSRPMYFWIWAMGFKLLGTAPLGWQIWTLLLRFFTILIFWIILRELWPHEPRRTALVAILFAVYPIFLLQPISLIYSGLWSFFFLTLLSFYFMVLAVKGKGSYFFLSACSILISISSLLSIEYFLGLEVLRPVVIWLTLEGSGFDRKKRLMRTIRHWIPYLVLLTGYLVWRFGFMPLGNDTNIPYMLIGIIKTPSETLPKVIMMFLQDMVTGLVGVWYATFQPSVITTTPISNLLAWGFVGIVFIGLTWLFLKVRALNQEGEDNNRFVRWAIILGLLVMVAGFIPGWGIGRYISDPVGGPQNSRFGLVAMAGASLFMVGFLEGLIKIKSVRTVAICLLVGLAVGQHFRNTSTFRWSWEQQLRMFWQLKWRAPQVTSPTGFYGNGALIQYMGSYDNTSAFNVLYQTQPGQKNQPYWYFDLYKTDIDNIIKSEIPLKEQVINLNFSGSFRDGLVFQEDAPSGQCLWVVSSEDRYNPLLETSVVSALPLSNMDRIQPGPEELLNSRIFEPEIAHDWCYYFEKADLAQQMKNWQKVMALWNDAANKGLHPHSEPEYIPFIEAAAHVGNWNLAYDLTKNANYPSWVMHDYLCTTWKKIDADTRRTNEQVEAINRVIKDFECQWLFQSK